MRQVITNSTVNGVLQSAFAVLVLVVVANAAVVIVKALRAGSLPTTEVPAQPSTLVEPAGLIATAEEKAAISAHRALIGSHTVDARGGGTYTPDEQVDGR